LIKEAIVATGDDPNRTPLFPDVPAAVGSTPGATVTVRRCGWHRLHAARNPATDQQGNHTQYSPCPKSGAITEYRFSLLRPYTEETDT